MTNQISKVMVWAVMAGLATPAAAMAGQAAAPQAAQSGAIQAPTQDQYVVGRALPPIVEGSQRIDMSLEAAIDRALQQNLDIQNARLNPQMQDYTLQAARAAYLPSLSTSYNYSNSQRQSTSQLDGGARTTTTSNSINTSLTKPFSWQGARLQVSFNNGRSASDSTLTTVNPSYTSNLSLNYSQPLLAGRTIDSQRNALRTGQIQRQITDIQLLTQIENIKNQVRTAYWALRQSIEAVEIQRRSLDLSRRNYEDNKVKVEVGTVAEIDLVQLESQIANGEQSLLAAEVAWRNAELAFKRLLVDSTDDDFFAATINPTDLPAFDPPEVDIAGAIARAVGQRTDIEQARQQLQISEMNLEVSKDSFRSSLDFSATYRVAGTAGNQYQRSGFGGAPVLIAESGYLDALKDIVKLTTPTWTAGLTFNKPLGMTSQKANYLRSQLALEQQKTSLRRTELDIATAVTRAGLDVQSTYKQLLAAQKSREAAERTLAAELTRFSVGMSTNFQVISLQNSLTSARNNELSATIRYINALAEFDRVQRIQ